MYQWIVFIHIASVLGLLIVHPVTVSFHMKQERVDVRIRELLEVTEAASRLRWTFFGLIIATGILLGFLGSWWGSAWIWIALAVFVAIGIVMNRYGGRTIDRTPIPGTMPRWNGCSRPSTRGSSRAPVLAVCSSSST